METVWLRGGGRISGGGRLRTNANAAITESQEPAPQSGDLDAEE